LSSRGWLQLSFHKCMSLNSRGSSFSMEIRLRVGRLTLYSWQGELNFFSLATASRLAARPNQPPIQWIPRSVSSELKRQWREDDHLPPSSAEVKKNVELYLRSSIRLHGVEFGMWVLFAKYYSEQKHA